jgi:hypothetical protein
MSERKIHRLAGTKAGRKRVEDLIKREMHLRRLSSRAGKVCNGWKDVR